MSDLLFILFLMVLNPVSAFLFGGFLVKRYSKDLK